MTGRTDHLFKRSRSPFWHVRFHYPRALHAHFGRKMVDINLKTMDRREAELALPDLLKRHRLDVFEAENRTSKRLHVAGFEYLHPLGSRIEEDGTRVIATQDTVVFLRGGQVVREEPNDLRIVPTFRFEHPTQTATKPTPKTQTNDDIVHLERWIAHRNVKPAIEKEARDAWALFQTLVAGKPLVECDRDDGRKLVNAYLDKGNKSKTIGKKVGHLGAAVALAIKESKLKFNPFSDVVPNLNDSERREPLNDEDMAKLRAGRDTFTPDQWKLLVLCATTGMRRGEAFNIDREGVEDGVRFVTVGTKTDQSLRRVPLPDVICEMLPAKITGPLFPTDLEPAVHLKYLGRETLRKMRRLGVEKDIHGLRHRAKDRLRRGRCPLDMQHHILGHEERTVAQGYGVGYPMADLKVEIEKIGL